MEVKNKYQKQNQKSISKYDKVMYAFIVLSASYFLIRTFVGLMYDV